MKRIIIFFLLLPAATHLYAQGYWDLLSGKSKELVMKGTGCWTEGGENCIAYLFEAYRLPRQSNGNCPGCIEVEIAKSYSYLEKFDSAQYFLNRATASLEKMNYTDMRVKHLDAEILNSAAMNFYYMGKIDSTIAYVKKNIEVIDKTGNKKSSAFAKMNLSSIYMTVEDYRSAVQYCLLAFNELKELDVLEDSRVAVLAGNLATCYHELGKLDSSMLWAARAIDWGQKAKSITAQVYGNYVMGANLSGTRPDSALHYLNQSLELARKSGRSNYVAKAQMMKGVLLGEMKRYTEARENLLEAVRLMEKNPADHDYTEAIRHLGLIANESGDYKLSAQYLREYVLIKDSLNVISNQQLLHEYQTKYETEKKEKQIGAQELKIQQQQSKLLYAILGGALLASLLGGIFIYNRKTQKLRLKQLRQEKDNAMLNAFILGEERERNRISHELHDGVAAMIGAAKMSLESIPHLPQEKRMEQLSKVKGILENTHADVRHIAHNLLPSVLEKEGIIKATEQFASEINEARLLTISVVDKNSNAHHLSQQLQLMLFRVIQELVNNIIKHSQAQNAGIVFQYTNGLQIEVTDDGIGYEDTTDSGNHGLYSITRRLESIGGNFRITKRNYGGTKAMVELNTNMPHRAV
ncbi:tetratricopeptide repeat-containing sensor histidine kinase [Terrimonas ferruginea]|uniref:tetratricopeptide repeat-containing sensor histidine kinase n=1 Tax=Terrimonas ferruginea TaxID=249 RepID=UPI0003FC0955|nr:histidine kinase [Terrimonas ferruginea]